MNEKTRQKALAALDGMATIVKAERLERGVYVTEEVVAPEARRNLCGGRNYCAVGSLWVGGGVKPVLRRDEDDPSWTWIELPGADQGGREEFLSRRPGLRAAYEALNAAARRYIDRHGISRDDLEAEAGDSWAADIEQLFEGSRDLGRTELLRMVNSAKRRLRAA